MTSKTKCPKTATMTSYKRPILYKNYVLLNGSVKVVFRQAYIDDVVNIVVNKIKKGTTI